MLGFSYRDSPTSRAKKKKKDAVKAWKTASITKSTKRYIELDNAAKDFYYNKRKMHKRRDVRPVAVFYYDGSPQKDVLYFPYQYFPPRHPYWAVVVFVGDTSTGTIRGYLPILNLLRTAVPPEDFNPSKEPNLRTVDKGGQIGPLPEHKAWVSMESMSSEHLLAHEPPITDPSVLLYNDQADNDQQQKKLTKSHSVEALRKSKSKRQNLGVGHQVDVKDDGQWYSATIKEVNDKDKDTTGGFLLLSFDGYTHHFDKWIPRNSLNLAPHRKFSKHNPMNTSTTTTGGADDDAEGPESAGNSFQRVPSENFKEFVSQNASLARTHSDLHSAMRSMSKLVGGPSPSISDNEVKHNDEHKRPSMSRTKSAGLPRSTSTQSTLSSSSKGSLRGRSRSTTRDNSTDASDMAARAAGRASSGLQAKDLAHLNDSAQMATIQRVHQDLSDWHKALAAWQRKLTQLTQVVSAEFETLRQWKEMREEAFAATSQPSAGGTVMMGSKDGLFDIPTPEQGPITPDPRERSLHSGRSSRSTGRIHTHTRGASYQTLPSSFAYDADRNLPGGAHIDHGRRRRERGMHRHAMSQPRPRGTRDYDDDLSSGDSGSLAGGRRRSHRRGSKGHRSYQTLPSYSYSSRKEHSRSRSRSRYAADDFQGSPDDYDRRSRHRGQYDDSQDFPGSPGSDWQPTPPSKPKKKSSNSPTMPAPLQVGAPQGRRLSALETDDDAMMSDLDRARRTQDTIARVRQTRAKLRAQRESPLHAAPDAAASNDDNPTRHRRHRSNSAIVQHRLADELQDRLKRGGHGKDKPASPINAVINSRQDSGADEVEI